MNLSCTTDSYDTLYARWLERPGALLDWGDYDPRKHPRLLDLCGGTGAVAKEALRRGARKVWLADLNPRVDDPRIIPVRGPAEELLMEPFDFAFDFVVCRQALGYLDLRKVAGRLFTAMNPGAIFTCNTFRKPKWSIRPYRFNDRWYLEASAYFGRKVFHLQATKGDFDVTSFRWYSTEEILMAFSVFQLHAFNESGPTWKFQFRR